MYASCGRLTGVSGSQTTPRRPIHPPESVVVVRNEPPTRAWTWSTTDDDNSSTSDSSSDLQTTISRALARHVRAVQNSGDPDHVACSLMDGLSEVFRMAMQPHFHESTIDLIINGGDK